MKTYKYICLFFLFVPPFIVNAQSSYFNERYQSVSNSGSGVFAIIETGNGFLIGGGTGSPPNDYWIQITLTVLDEKGLKTDEKLIGDTLSQYYVAERSFTRTADNLITFAGTRRTWFPEFSHTEVLLAKLNNEYDTLWSKYYGELVLPYDSAFGARQLIETLDSNLVIVGTMVPHIDYHDNAFLIKTDKEGNKISEWLYNYPDPAYKLRGFCVIETPDKGFAIGAYRFKSGYNYTGEPMVYKVDSLGNEEWDMDVGSPFYDDRALLCNTHDGNIMSASCYADSMSGNDNAYRTINIKKIDMEGNVIWDKRYGPSNQRNYIGNIRPVPGGGYIVTGTLFTADQLYPNPWLSGWMLRIDNEGDSLWFRQYHNTNGTYDMDFLYDVIPTSDNGFAACGEVSGEVTNNTQHAWVIKVDSMGCDTPGCATGVQVFEFPVISNGELRIWPNPTSKSLKVNSYGFKEIGEKLIAIYNLQGIKMDEIKIQKSVESIEVDVSKYHMGIYYLQYICSGRIMGTAKFIKN